MTGFILAVLGLTLGALALLTRPLWSRPKDARAAQRAAEIAGLRAQVVELETAHAAGRIAPPEHATALEALERRIVATVVEGAEPGPAVASPGRGESLSLSVVLGASVAVFGALGYAVVGTPQAIAPLAVAAASPASAADAQSITPQQVEQLIERLAVRLKERPDDIEGWTILGRSQSVLGRHDEAAQAFRQALALRPGDAMLMAHYADALAVVQRGFEGEPDRWIEKALATDPGNLKALSLAGSSAYERRDYAAAMRHWEKMVALAPSAEFRQQIQAGIDEARKLMAGQGAANAANAANTGAAVTQAAAASASVSVSGTVTLAPALAGKAGPDDTVFVYARAAGGTTRMPLAIVRKQVKDLPFEFVLDDSHAMSPQSRLSSASSVVVGARISRTGDARPAPGDLEGVSVQLPPGSRDVRVEIGQVVGL